MNGSTQAGPERRIQSAENKEIWQNESTKTSLHDTYRGCKNFVLSFWNLELDPFHMNSIVYTCHPAVVAFTCKLGILISIIWSNLNLVNFDVLLYTGQITKTQTYTAWVDEFSPLHHNYASLAVYTYFITHILGINFGHLVFYFFGGGTVIIFACPVFIYLAVRFRPYRPTSSLREYKPSFR